MASERDHRLQEHASWCVPACVEIVVGRRGAVVAQSALVEQWHAVHHGYALDDAAGYLGTALLALDPTAPSTYRWLEAQLADGAWIIAYVFAEPLVEIQTQRGAQLRSPHGSLSGNRHTIVFCGYRADTYLYLDPYFEAGGQPFGLGREECVEVLQSHVLVIPP